MIRHIVMWRIEDKQEGNKLDVATQIKQVLSELPSLIDEIITFEVGINEVSSSRAADVVLQSSFKSYADLESYRVHPEHQRVAQYIQSVVAESWVVDYTI